MEGNPMMGKGWVMRTAVLAMAAVMGTDAFAAFNTFEREKILAYWAQSERYTSFVPESTKGTWQVRLTSDGSLWLWALNQKRGLGKIFSNPVPRNDEERKWEDWISAKVAYDRWMAGLTANLANAAMGVSPADIGPEPSLPGAIPESLYRMVGDAPNFAQAVQPKQHSITFHDGYKVAFQDNTKVDPRYPYYRFEEGVRHGGQQVKKMPAEDLDKLFAEANIPDAAQKVMKAVSMLEGGFDSVNTYDTGYVSVGFIQFACASRGAGSLGAVLQREKAANSQAFESDFKQLGIDVKDDGTLQVLGLTDGNLYEGYDAALQIIKDKRLIAIFQRAGATSRPFKIAQLQVAREQYYPADETFQIKFGNETKTVKVSDLVKSEAGMATVMDRKVNTGKISPLPTKAQEIAKSFGVKSVEELAQYEREIVANIRFRKSYLDDETLTQPAQRERNKQLTSRKSTRKGRGN